ncbi:glycosyltransferase family 9 protein [Hydrotalea sp.]|uniref:glycosyltransferase family 9 protein n=1 Tax=Hydrotalea sp. TaxID=2881279 RepID=UPI0025856570|nr:glycosyltransferase family 9 protein [Hydrotalea sp.]
MEKVLLIQTAFIGDVVLATGLLEKIHAQYPETLLHVLVRKGNELLFEAHPYIKKVLIWDKKKQKYRHLIQLIFQIRKEKYTRVINVQRFAATGLLTAFSGAAETIGFRTNPFSCFFTKSITHHFGENGTPLHEIERNQQLIAHFTNGKAALPKLYYNASIAASVQYLQNKKYICIAPASVWFTKQYPVEKWIELIHQIPDSLTIYLLGAVSDNALCANIAAASSGKQVENLAGKLSFLQSAALMETAFMNYVNDSAPMHFASAVNAPVTVVYCSTIPAFGYGPLSHEQYIVGVQELLSCRPCGIHGRAGCPQGHFHCALHIQAHQLLQPLHIKMQQSGYVI